MNTAPQPDDAWGGVASTPDDGIANFDSEDAAQVESDLALSGAFDAEAADFVSEDAE